MRGGRSCRSAMCSATGPDLLFAQGGALFGLESAEQADSASVLFAGGFPVINVQGIGIDLCR